MLREIGLRDDSVLCEGSGVRFEALIEVVLDPCAVCGDEPSFLVVRLRSAAPRKGARGGGREDGVMHAV